MKVNSEKSSLRKLLLEKRDSLSADFIEIASKKIHKNLKKIQYYQAAKTIAAYYSIGSEVRTHDILQDILSEGKTLALPRVEGDHLIFCNITRFEDLEKGEFGIMEPKQNCPQVDEFDVVLVPAIAMTKRGQRLGYGRGFYDRFLADKESTTIALTYSKFVVKNIPFSEGDVRIHLVVTEDEIISSGI
ncbi:MAG TPA: 5-formyltetrahydrofolate cyclo-ligase [Candidatus Nitrosotenuis sp.]|nr:5-formyltetrahydrofolate cyclo-ligase [Candidatus Nitrosotenuis sp.]